MCLSCFISLGQSRPRGTEHGYSRGIAQGGQVFSLFCTNSLFGPQNGQYDRTWKCLLPDMSYIVRLLNGANGTH